MVNTRKQNELTYSRSWTISLVASIAVMAAYIVLAYWIMGGLFWTFASVHVILFVVTVAFALLGSRSRLSGYIALSAGVAGVVTALVMLIYYFTIINNLVNS